MHNEFLNRNTKITCKRRHAVHLVSNFHYGRHFTHLITCWPTTKLVVMNGEEEWKQGEKHNYAYAEFSPFSIVRVMVIFLILHQFHSNRLTIIWIYLMMPTLVTLKTCTHDTVYHDNMPSHHVLGWWIKDNKRIIPCQSWVQPKSEFELTSWVKT